MRTYEGSRKCNDINIYYLCKNDGIGNLLGGGGKGGLPDWHEKCTPESSANP